jgi:hypothetical protein
MKALLGIQHNKEVFRSKTVGLVEEANTQVFSDQVKPCTFLYQSPISFPKPSNQEIML